MFDSLMHLSLCDGYLCCIFYVSVFIFCQVATKTLPFYKEYFSVPYPLPKIDLIAIADFAAGESCSHLNAQFELLLL